MHPLSIGMKCHLEFKSGAKWLPDNEEKFKFLNKLI